MTAPTIGATPKKALDQRATSRHDNAVTLEMGEPGAAGRPLPQNAGRRGSLDDRVGEPPLSHEIPPGRRMRPNSLSLGRAFGDWPVRVISASCPVDWWEARRQSGEFAQALADVAEAQAWLEPLHQPEDVAFGVAGRIPPPASGMADDQDFAFASPVLQAESRVLLPIQFPRRRGSLQHLPCTRGSDGRRFRLRNCCERCCYKRSIRSARSGS